MKYNRWIYGITTAAVLTILAACSKMDATYKDYLGNGENIYVGKVDSVTAQAGKDRLQLTFLLISDPKVSTYKVYWNGRQDSVVNNVVRGAGVDTIRVIIDKNLIEGPNNFEIFTFDTDGHTSVKVSTIGYMYGDNYESSLVNRALKSIGATEDGSKAVLTWFPARNGEVGVELVYMDNMDMEHKIIVPASETITEIADYKEKSPFQFRALYKPEESAIDTFPVEFSEDSLPVFERKLDKSQFLEYPLPTDASTGFGWVMPRLWDENINVGYATANGSGMNRWFTFDLGTTVTLSKYRLWQSQDRIFRDQNPYTWEIWGTDNPPADGSFTNWTKLMDCQAIKPSGLPLGQVSTEDQDYAKAGQEFVFADGLPPVRYIRIKYLSIWGNQSFLTLGEISFWTHDH